MPMTEHEAHALLDAWIESEPESPARADIARRLHGDPLGRVLLEAHGQLVEAPDTTAVDVVPGTMARIPPGSPLWYRRAADVVVKAWSEPRLRGALRDAPAATLSRAGLALPSGVRIEVLPATADVPLPTPERLPLPLPDVDAPAINVDRARGILAATPFGWLWGPPWTRPMLDDRATGTAPGVASGRRRLSWSGTPISWRRAVLGLVAVGAVLVLYVVLTGPVRLLPLSGSAVIAGPADATLLVAGGAGAIVLLFLLLLRRRP
jgi:hypothetical protein